MLEAGAPNLDFSVLEGIPTLGICYGHQLMALRLGGVVESSPHREYGLRTLDPTEETGHLVSELNSPQVWMSHGDQGA